MRIERSNRHDLFADIFLQSLEIFIDESASQLKTVLEKYTANML